MKTDNQHIGQVLVVCLLSGTRAVSAVGFRRTDSSNGMGLGDAKRGEAVEHGAPLHPGNEPDRKRPATFQGSIIGSPVRGFVFLRYGFAHAAWVKSWIPHENPSRLLVQQNPPAPKTGDIYQAHL
jgi:hypothetical protein